MVTCRQIVICDRIRLLIGMNMIASTWEDYYCRTKSL